jgi:outer membrane cobalamin receptor
MKTDRLCGAALLLLLSSFGALAAQPPATASTSADPAAQSPEQARPDGEKPRPCLQTGSRLPSKGHCVNAAGQVVTREELEATGAMNLGDALSRTVPSATVR